MRGEKVAVLAEDREVSPNEAAAILGMSRPLVVHRMDVGDLPFRYVGKHRRAKLRDVQPDRDNRAVARQPVASSARTVSIGNNTRRSPRGEVRKPRRR